MSATSCPRWVLSPPTEPASADPRPGSIPGCWRVGHGGLQHLGVRLPSDEPVLDLHGLRVSDAVRRATVFLVAEQQRGTVAVRIVTGHGTGALKQAIRSLLASHPAVATVQRSLQGDAAVLVVLKPSSRTPRRPGARA